MTGEDVDRIERELGIKLPSSYRAVVVPYPIAAAVGNATLAVWDDPGKLVDFNRQLRRSVWGGVPWPEHLFALGHPGDGSPYALDLRGDDVVLWVDRCHLENAGTSPEALPFSGWASEYFRALDEEMAGGREQRAQAPQQPAADRRNELEASIGCVVLLLAIVGLAFAIRWIVRVLA